MDNMCDVRFAKLIGTKDELLVEADKSMELNVCKWDADTIERAMHGYELPESSRLYLKAAVRQMGVGGYDSWGARTLEEYINPSGKAYSFSFTLIP